MKKVDINVDVAEGFPHDEALLEIATSANICCGEHAGSWDLTLRTIESCNRHGVRIGCHPGFPDRESFGRRLPEPEECVHYAQSIATQVLRFCTVRKPEYLKPHGAWYEALSDSGRASGRKFELIGQFSGIGILQGIEANFDLPLMMIPGSIAIAEVQREFHMSVYREGFADRRYGRNGLVKRSDSNALLANPGEIRKQVLRLAPRVDSICVHGDTPGCVDIAVLVRRTLEDAGYEVGY